MTFEEQLTPMPVQNDFMISFFGRQEIVTDGEAAELEHMNYQFGIRTNPPGLNTGRNKRRKVGTTQEGTSHQEQQKPELDTNIYKKKRPWALPKGVVPTLARLRPKPLPIPSEPSIVRQQAATPMLNPQTDTNDLHKATLRRRKRSSYPDNDVTIRPQDQSRITKRRKYSPKLADGEAEAQPQVASQPSPPVHERVYRERSPVRQQTIRTSPPTSQKEHSTVEWGYSNRTRQKARRGSALRVLNESPPPVATQRRSGRSVSPRSTSQASTALDETTELKRQP